MVIKQLRNPWIIVPAVVVGNILLTMAQLYKAKEFTMWSQFPDVLNHASLSAFSTTIGWLFIRSPWAAKITEIMGPQTTPGPDGPTILAAKMTISEPPPETPTDSGK